MPARRPPSPAVVKVHFTIELGSRQVTAEVSPTETLLRTALRGSTTTKRHARHMIIHRLILPQLLRRGIRLDRLNWIDGPPAEFPVITRIIAGSQVIHRHSVTECGDLDCVCLNKPLPPYCPVHGPT